MSSINEKMTALADAVRSKANRSDTLTIDAMTAAVNGLAVGTPSTKSLTVTPTKSAQTFSSSDLGVNTYYSTVTVNAIPAEYVTTTDATATRVDILAGKTAYAYGEKVTGSMTDYGDVVKKFNNISDTLSIPANGYFNTIKVTLTKKELTITPSVKTQHFNVFTDEENDVFYSKVTVNGDTNLTPENIAKDVTVFGVKGTYKGTDTSDATVTAADLLYGVTAYGKDGKVTGSISTVTATRDANVITVPRGFIAQEQVLIVEEMPAVSVQGNSVSIAAGYNSTPQSITVGTAKAAETYTPGVDDVIIPADSYLTGSQIIKGDNNLRPENIAKDITIFGVTGDFEGNAGIDTSDATVTPSDLLAGVTAYGANGLVVGEIETVRPSVVKNTVTLPKGYVNEDQTITVGTSVSAREYTPGTADITIPADAYLAGDQTIKGDGALISENIKAGVSIFNVSGSFTADANATSSDIASGKTAYVNGEMVVGTASGGAVVPIWYYEKYALRTQVPPSKNCSVPTREGAADFMVLDGKLTRFTGGYSPLPSVIHDSSNWSYVNVRNYYTAWGICDGNLYKIYVDSSSNLQVQQAAVGVSGITQCCDTSWGGLFISNGSLYGCNALGEKFVRVEYRKDKDTDPTVYVAARKILNFSQYYENFWVITSDGSLANGWLDKESFDHGDGAAYAQIYDVDLANGNSFVNYHPMLVEDYGGDGGVYCEFAFRQDGLWYRQAGESYVNGKWVRNAWNKADDPGLRKTDWLGGCYVYAEEDWETGEYTINVNTIALHIDEQGRLWKIVPQAQMSGYNIVLTGIELIQVGEDSDWQCVPPSIGKSSNDRPDWNRFAQKGGKVINIWATNTYTFDIHWEEYPLSIPGKMICGNDQVLYFVQDGVTVDLSEAGGIV